MSKEKKREPIKVMLRVTIVLAVVAVAALLLGNAIIGYRANLLKARQEEAEEINNQKAEEYAVALAEFARAEAGRLGRGGPDQLSPGECLYGHGQPR